VAQAELESLFAGEAARVRLDLLQPQRRAAEPAGRSMASRQMRCAAADGPALDAVCARGPSRGGSAAAGRRKSPRPDVRVRPGHGRPAKWSQPTACRGPRRPGVDLSRAGRERLTLGAGPHRRLELDFAALTYRGAGERAVPLPTGGLRRRLGSMAGKQRQVSYSRIPAGHYTFRGVGFRTADGRVDAIGRQRRDRRAAFLWQTWWFPRRRRPCSSPWPSSASVRYWVAPAVAGAVGGRWSSRFAPRIAKRRAAHCPGHP